uniref:DUF19 domain-containing protein n=1 Tax=Trichuris muris TaxID=70415 RepID=A0A5S6R147_TRIMR
MRTAFTDCSHLAKAGCKEMFMATDELRMGLFVLFMCLIAADAAPAVCCGEEATRFHVCLYKNYVPLLDKFRQFDQRKFLETASICFSSNGCRLPSQIWTNFNDTGNADEVNENESKESESNGQDSGSEETDSNKTLNKALDVRTLQVAVIQTVLNPKWFPNATNKIITGHEEECMNKSYHVVNMMVQACIQRSLPGFRFPVKEGIPAHLLYFGMAIRAHSSPHRFFTTTAGMLHRHLRTPGVCTGKQAKLAEDCLSRTYMREQRDSFREILRLEQAFALLCNISTSCFFQSKEQCRPSIRALGEIECECSLDLIPKMTNMLTEDYSRCFQTNVSRDAVESALRTKMNIECLRQRRGMEMCLKGFDDLL